MRLESFPFLGIWFVWLGTVTLPALLNARYSVGFLLMDIGVALILYAGYLFLIRSRDVKKNTPK